MSSAHSGCARPGRPAWVRERRRARAGMAAGRRRFRDGYSWSTSSTRWPRRPTSRSPKIRVPVTRFMIAWRRLPWFRAAARAPGDRIVGQPTLIKYPISYHEPQPTAANYDRLEVPRELFDLLFMVAGTFAILGICQPFARDRRRSSSATSRWDSRASGGSAARSVHPGRVCSRGAGGPRSSPAWSPMPPWASRSLRSGPIGCSAFGWAG